MMETETRTLVDELAYGMMPTGLVGRMVEPDANIPQHYRDQAQLCVELLKQVLASYPQHLTELGWQRIGLKSESDLLQRTQVQLFAPPERSR